MTGGGALNANDVAHVVQTALAPVFMLTAIGSLLNVFGSRLARVGDQAEQLSMRDCDAAVESQLRLLRRRSLVLDAAIVAAALAGALTCASVFVLFVAALVGRTAAVLLFGLFGGAVLLTMLSVIGFVTEMLLAARGVRREVDRTISSVET